MSGPELFDGETGDEDGIELNDAFRSESESDLESPPVRTSMTVRKFFSKKRQRAPSVSNRHELKQHVQQGGSSNDCVGTSQSKRRRGQLPKDNYAYSVTPNRPSSGRSKVTPETLRSSQSKGDENVDPRAAAELDTSTKISSSQDDPSVNSALKEITSLLNTVVKRVERIETELKKQSSSSSSTDSTPCSKTIVAVPRIVRVGCKLYTFKSIH